MNAYAVIVGGGSGRRMKLKTQQSKLFLRLQRRPILYYTLRAFEESSSIKKIVVVSSKQDIKKVTALIKQYRFSKIGSVVIGGKERQDSVYHGLTELAKLFSCGDTDVALIHDGARPFIQPSEINDITRLVKKHHAVVPYTTCTDTIKKITAGFFSETIPRERIAAVQTPQAFTWKMLWTSHQIAKREVYYSTDDSSLVEKYYPNQRIFGYEMGYHNIKITTPEDIYVANYQLKNTILKNKIQ